MPSLNHAGADAALARPDVFEVRQGAVRPPERQVDLRGIVPQVDVIGLALEQHFAADRILIQHLHRDGAPEARAIVIR